MCELVYGFYLGIKAGIDGEEIPDEDEASDVEDESALTPLPEYVILWTSPEIIGKFRDIPIPAEIKTTDGKSYKYDSVAIQSRPGIFDVDDDASYVIVADCLLYREIEPQLSSEA